MSNFPEWHKPYRGFYWVEAWVPELHRWASTTAFWSMIGARLAAANRAACYERPYRVTDELRREHGRWSGVEA